MYKQLSFFYYSVITKKIYTDTSIRRLLNIGLLLAFFGVTFGAGDTIYVPDDYPSIGEAAMVSEPWDTIIVRDGVYTGRENTEVNLHCVLKSENGPENCIVDFTNSDFGYHIHRIDGLGLEMLLAGFTFRNSSSRTVQGELINGKLENCVFENNLDGALDIRATNSTIDNCVFTNNSTNDSGVFFLVVDDGGVIVSNCTFTGNSALDYGGAMHVLGFMDCTIRNCTFTGNSAQDGGGAIAIRHGVAYALESCTFTGNTCVTDGSAVYLEMDNTVGSISDCLFTDNESLTGKSVIGSRFAGTIDDCLITDNTGTGIIREEDYYGLGFQVSNCEILNNTCTGIEAGGDSASILVFLNNIIAENRHGGINVSNDFLMKGCTISNNYSTDSGAGIMIGLGSEFHTCLNLENCLIAGNASEKYGGGIYLISNREGQGHFGPTIRNCTIVDNISRLGGGGLFAEHGGFYSLVMLQDSIFYGNDANDLGDQIATTTSLSGYHPIQDADLEIEYSNIQGGQESIYIFPSSVPLDPEVIYLEGNLDVDPFFVESGTWVDPNDNGSFADAQFTMGDYHLRSVAGRWDADNGSGAGQWIADPNMSPCIDAGDPNSIYADELWPHGQQVNLGAYGNTNEASLSLRTDGNKYNLNCDPDGVVNLYDFSLFSNNWLCENKPAKGDFNFDGTVDLDEFVEFANNWLMEN